ncbi:DNA mismatch repair enzyme (predicted ATPase) [Thermus oshimai JL-2]|uniref:DNA mismatch repair enzyme (Predicted ATPase) n=1 Tax=Thermus oshimai JL-2 TaxID=751945 RepID=K7QYA7_THEOS|nr:DNA mismatch repair endonuclease MutL [Thermus oshimai]AFV75585.1 DNA mismatch repair enzyme (predicted ATPase) [Thermus oshimai JL-2]
MIRPLPEPLRALLAEGEVLLGLKDAVRELLENALDARAKRVKVELWEGGKTLAVEDDGEGIPFAELPLAVAPFSTSKLLDPERIATLGFRGQALYALAQAEALRIRSRPRGQVGGGLLLVERGEIQAHREVPAPPGTRVEVRFREAPEKGEVREVLLLLKRYLLHHPRLHLLFFAEGKALLLFPGAGLKEAARLQFGRVLSERLFPVRKEGEGMVLEALLSRPEASRTGPEGLFLSVNGRPVALPKGVLLLLRRAYRELLPEGHYPYGVLNLTLPPGAFRLRLDARKEEVRLSSEAEAFLEEALRAAFAGEDLARTLPEKALSALRPVQALARPHLKYLGQFRESYLLAEAGSTLYVVDQHAAHERILFEELRKKVAEGPAPLPKPLLVPLEPEEALRLPEREEALRALFAFEPFGPGRVRLLGAPSFLHPYPLLLPEVFREVLREEGKSLRGLLARLACLPALKAGHPLAQAEGQALLDALLACETPWACPHGRPTLLALEEAELIRRFGRRSGVRGGGEGRPHRPPETAREEP